MSMLSGTMAISPQGGYVNAYVTKALRGTDPAWIGWPTFQADTVKWLVGPSQQCDRHHAIFAVPGVLGRSYMDDYYYRVHLRPGSLDLGQLSTAQQRTIEVWNAWPEKSLTLNSVQALDADGIIVTAPGVTPFVFAPMQSSLWSVTVTSDGPGRIDATMQWLFADASENVSIEITGNRLTAWSVPPDWSSGITETLIWLTEVGDAVDGTQDRTPMRENPQRQWEADYLVQGQDRQLMESLLYGSASRSYVVPVWWDVDTLPMQLTAGVDSLPLATAGRDYAVGSQVMLWLAPNVYELVEVASIEANAIHLAHPLVDVWPEGSRVWPCRNAILSETPKLTRRSDQVSKSTIRFEVDEECDWPALAPATLYLGYPVLEDRTNEADDPEANYTRKTQRLDDNVSFPVVDDLSGLAFPAQSQAWFLHQRDAHAAHRSLLYWLNGRAQALWVPSWQGDLTLTGLVAANSVSLNVYWAGVARYLDGLPGRRHIRIELKDGTVFYRAVTNAEEIGQSSENLAIDTSLGRQVVPEDVRAISWMMLATLAGDSVEIQHVTDADGLGLCTTTFVGVPKEEP